MNVEDKTQGLEIDLAKVRKDVSYLKKKMDKVEIKLEKMDEKTDKLIVELPEIIRTVLENYVPRKEFEAFTERFKDSAQEHEEFEQRIGKIETKFAIGAAIFSAVLFLLSFGETIAKWLTNLVHHQ